MKKTSARAFRTLRLPLAAVILVSTLACKDATLGPQRTGHIEGQVLEAESAEPVAGASITTSPASEAITTDEEGRFRLENLEVGQYSVSASRFDYPAASVSVLVQEGRTSTATIFVEPEADVAAPTLEAEVLGWWNVSQGDSAFVETEYRVHNAGSTDIEAYEVYFRIATDQNVFFHEEQGDSLPASQSNIRRFRTYIVDRTATDVLVEGVWTDG